MILTSYFQLHAGHLGAWAQNLNSALKQNQAYKSSNLGGGAAAGSGSQHHPQFDNLAAQSLEKDAKRQRDLEKQRAKQQKERERQAQQFAKQYERNEALQVKARERAAQEAQKALDKQAKHAGRTAGKQGKHLGNGAAPAAAPQSGGRPKSAGRLRAYPSGSEGAVDLPPVHPFRSLPSQPARPATSGYPAASNITVSGSLGSLDDDALGLDESESLSEQTEQTHPTASQAPPDASVPGQQQAHQQKQQQQQQQQAGQGAAATAAAGNSRGLNAPPPKRSDLERVVDRVQKKDFYEIFKHPVTEDVAPGYFKVVERAMDFTTMRAKLESNQYQSWDMLQEDMEVMFNNAMAYNTAETIYHKQAQTLLGVANKLIGLARNGVTDFRGRTAGIVRAHNAQIAAEEKKDRDARRLQERNEKAAVRSAKLAERAAASGIDISQLQLLEAEDGGADGAKLAPGRAMFKEERRSVFIDENARNTYHRIPRDQTFQRWKGLARGANGEGMAFAKGFPWLRATVNLAMPPETYARSLARFAAGLTGRAREIALARAADSISPAAASPPSAVSKCWHC
ncbi:hypothetical protein WJX72_007549 [[Myrmecia] bisecta]|uniref:Bromo domain-containing protein n=1 Tax=[Myrmecia] bisecta TaxID=41462 RepID=A0AAW1R7X4_9CHLO